ncbi:YvrJ family protein [Solibacillus silvestris]
MDQWIAIIQEVTFPIFISFYLLYRIETKLEAIHSALVVLHNPNERI